jgi:hypothetical protein
MGNKDGINKEGNEVPLDIDRRGDIVEADLST